MCNGVVESPEVAQTLVVGDRRPDYRLSLLIAGFYLLLKRLRDATLRSPEFWMLAKELCQQSRRVCWRMELLRVVGLNQAREVRDAFRQAVLKLDQFDLTWDALLTDFRDKIHEREAELSAVIERHESFTDSDGSVWTAPPDEAPDSPASQAVPPKG